MSKVVMIFLDAFSSRYLDPQNAPFLYKLSQEAYYTPLKPMFAFQGIGAAIFSGTLPNTNRIWCDYIFNGQKNPKPRLFKLLLKLCNLIPNDILSQYARYPIYKIFHQNFGLPNIVPPNLLDYFELKQGKKYTEENSLSKIVTLFDQLRSYNVKYYVSGLYESIFDKRTMKDALKSIEKDYELILFKLGALDKLGHKYGPKSTNISKKVSEINDFLKEIVGKAFKLKENTYFMIFSDHGMSPVLKTINLLDILQRLPVKILDDYFLFLNSTVASFWFNNQKAKENITEVLAEADFGEILDKRKLKGLGIDKIGSEHGELIFALKEGCVFFPDFYRKHTPPKGMHGYSYPSYDAPILFIYSPNSSGDFEKRETVKHIDIMPTVLDLLNLPVPLTCEGKSLLRKR